MDNQEFVEFVKNSFSDIDLVNQGLVIKVKTKKGDEVVGLPDNSLKSVAQTVGVNPQIIDQAKQLPPEQRKKVALKLLYMMMQNEEFKKRFFENLQKRGVVYIPDTAVNQGFSMAYGLAILILIGLLLVMIILAFLGVNP